MIIVYFVCVVYRKGIFLNLLLIKFEYSLITNVFPFVFPYVICALCSFLFKMEKKIRFLLRIFSGLFV